MNKHVEELVWGLFVQARIPFYDGEKLSPVWIDEFARDKEVQLLTFEFVRNLSRLWGARFPGILKPALKKRSDPEAVVKAMEFPSLLTSAITLPVALPSDSASSQPLDFPLRPIQPPVTGDPVTERATNTESDDSVAPDIPVAEASTTLAATKQPIAPVLPAAASDSSSASGLKPGQIPDATLTPAVIPDSQPIFHLPNCKVGTAYSAKICVVNKPSRPVVVADLRFPDGFGLSFDTAAQVVSGQPLLDGEFDLGLQWCFADAPNDGKASGTCRLIANPNPRSLWKIIEPAAELPYRKAHLDHKLVKGTGCSIAVASRRGRSHEHGGSFRDDDFFIADDPANGWSVLIVADGAGSAKNSREGSRIAVETAGKHLVDSLAGAFGARISAWLASWDSDPSSQSAIGTEFHYFFHKMAGNAVQAIEQQAQSDNTPVKEYATTLLVAAVRREKEYTFLATFWMGDGAIAAYGPKGTVKLMGTPDGGEFAGQTRFLDRSALADQRFGKRVRVGLLPNVSAVILMTDGVSDPFFETDNGLADPARWDLLWNEIEAQLSDAAPEQRLLDWLHFFKPGHHDDRTIALLW
ncbi:MAG: PP2C family serine/threonine-protein phosphatase [Candidatus Accumulibacter propinquus]